MAARHDGGEQCRGREARRRRGCRRRSSVLHSPTAAEGGSSAEPEMASVAAAEGAAAALRSVLSRAQQAAARAGRAPASVCVVAVSKTKPVPVIRSVYDAGNTPHSSAASAAASGGKRRQSRLERRHQLPLLDVRLRPSMRPPRSCSKTSLKDCNLSSPWSKSRPRQAPISFKFVVHDWLWGFLSSWHQATVVVIYFSQDME